MKKRKIKAEPLSKRDRVRRVLSIGSVIIVISAAVYLGIAFTLVFTDEPIEHPLASAGGIGFSEAIEADYSALPDTITYTARDAVSSNGKQICGKRSWYGSGAGFAQTWIQSKASWRL